MWAHYADSFRGVCLVYDFYELANNAPFIPLKVQYLAQIPKFNYIRHRLQDTSASDPHNVLTSNTEFDQMMFGMKTLDWAYEREYRLVSFTQGKNSINPTSLKGIIFGSRTTSDQKEKLEALLAQYSVDIETSTLVLNPRSKEVEITAFENEMITRKDVRLRNLYQTTRANI